MKNPGQPPIENSIFAACQKALANVFKKEDTSIEIDHTMLKMINGMSVKQSGLIAPLIVQALAASVDDAGVLDDIIKVGPVATSIDLSGIGPDAIINAMEVIAEMRSDLIRLARDGLPRTFSETDERYVRTLKGVVVNLAYAHDLNHKYDLESICRITDDPKRREVILDANPEILREIFQAEGINITRAAGRGL